MVFLTGYSKSYIYKIETGEKPNLSFNALKKMEKVLSAKLTLVPLTVKVKSNDRQTEESGTKEGKGSE